MGIQVRWDTAEQAVVRLDFEAQWRWVEYDHAVAEAKRLMREVLDHYLEQRAIFSRRVVRDLQALDDDNGGSEERRS